MMKAIAASAAPRADSGTRCVRAASAPCFRACAARTRPWATALRLPGHLAGQLGGLGLCPALDVHLGGELLYRLAEMLPGPLDFLAKLLGVA